MSDNDKDEGAKSDEGNEAVGDAVEAVKDDAPAEGI